MLVFLSSTCSLVAANGTHDQKPDIEYLKNNFDSLYTSDTVLFWEVLHDAAEQIKRKDVKLIASVMEISFFVKGNAEVSEFFSELFEPFCISNSEICLKALTTLKAQYQSSFLDRMRQPLFVSKTEIDKIFSNNRHNESYNKIIKLYFKEEK